MSPAFLILPRFRDLSPYLITAKVIFVITWQQNKHGNFTESPSPADRASQGRLIRLLSCYCRGKRGEGGVKTEEVK